MNQKQFSSYLFKLKDCPSAVAFGARRHNSGPVQKRVSVSGTQPAEPILADLLAGDRARDA